MPPPIINNQSTNNHFFAYGSLMAGINSPITRFLKANSEFVGEGYLRGTLYDIGQYPGLVYEPKNPNKVVGHIFKMKDPKIVLEALDCYECVGDEFEKPWEYERQLLPIHPIESSNPPTLLCWVYTYNWSVLGLKKIESGNYLTYFQENKDYQEFINALNNS